MSYHKVPQENYPPPGYGTVYPPPAGNPYPPPPGHGGAYQGYFNEGYPPPPPPPPPPPQIYHHYEHHHHDDHFGCTSFLRGWYVGFFYNCCNFLCDLMIRIFLFFFGIRAILQLVGSLHQILVKFVCVFVDALIMLHGTKVFKNVNIFFAVVVSYNMSAIEHAKMLFFFFFFNFLFAP